MATRNIIAYKRTVARRVEPQKDLKKSILFLNMDHQAAVPLVW
jgi:hypothetical protein